MDRRTFSLGAVAVLAAGCSPEAGGKDMQRLAGDMAKRFDAIRSTLGSKARLGVAAIDTQDGRTIGFNEDERFAMASTFKLPLAAFVLAEHEAGRLKLAEEVPFAPGDPLANSPVVEAHRARGRLPVEQLAAAIVQRSDNSAANLLLGRTGGPQALTRRLRGWGDRATRLDRFEMELNSNLPSDPRDTTMPAAMAELVRRLLAGNLLTQSSRARLAYWLESAVPGPDRLRAGLPADWRFGHKTGTGARGAHNDVGIAWPPGRPPIVIASFQDGGDADGAVRAAAHASAARLVVELLG